MGTLFRPRPPGGSSFLLPSPARSPAAGAPPARPRRRSPAQRVLRLAITLLILGELLDGARAVRRRTGRRVGAWWDAVEHRERRRSRRAELTALARRLTPHDR